MSEVSLKNSCKNCGKKEIDRSHPYIWCKDCKDLYIKMITGKFHPSCDVCFDLGNMIKNSFPEPIKSIKKEIPSISECKQQIDIVVDGSIIHSRRCSYGKDEDFPDLIDDKGNIVK